MIFGKKTQVTITQSRLHDGNGKPGSLTVPGVATMDIKDGHLMGSDAAGNITVIVPLVEIAAAIVEEVKRG